MVRNIELRAFLIREAAPSRDFIAESADFFGFGVDGQIHGSLHGPDDYVVTGVYPELRSG